MEIVIVADYEKVSMLAAQIISEELKKRPNLVLGLATGETPLGTYRELTRLHREEGLDFSGVTTFNLDEYVGFSLDHPSSYNYFMWDTLFNHINVNPSRVNIPKGDASHLDTYCSQYEEKIKQSGGIDIQLLGIGSDGHIAFNEPGSSLASRTRVTALDRQTIADNSRFFSKEEDVPRFAITMGVGTILEAKRILLIASGKKKAGVCAQFIEGPITSQITATALQLHPAVTVVLDVEASSKLKRQDFYRWAMKAREEQFGR